MYFIKPNYIENFSPQYYLDTPGPFEYQPRVYQLAAYLGKRGNKKYIIDLGSGNGIKLKQYCHGFHIITIDCGTNSFYVDRPFHHITFNFENGLPNIPENILAHSIIISADVIEHLVNPQFFLTCLSNWAKIAPYVLITTPDRNIVRGLSDYGPPANKAHVREWSLQEFRELLHFNGFGNFFIGHTENTSFHKQKTSILAVAGNEINYSSRHLVNILAIIHCYNESDIICESIRHLLKQGVDVFFVDNHSTDNSYEIVKAEFHNNNRVFIAKSPNYGNSYEWHKLLKVTETISHQNKDKYHWFMHHDSDELRYSPFKHIPLQQMISFVDSLGYNAIDFTVIDFRFTKNNNNVKKEFEKHLLSFQFGRRPGHFRQIKCWKYAHDLNLADSGGHSAEFQNRKVYPIKFLLKHYPLRNIEQANRKIFQERLPRIAKEKSERGWHGQYDEYIKKKCAIDFKDYNLIRWHENIFDIEYLVERISGIGVEIE